MLSKNTLIVLLFLSVVHFSDAQITPIEVVVDTKKTTYSTNSHGDNKLIVKNQSFDLKRKLQENIKISDNISPLFIKQCLDETTYTSVKNSKIIFSIEYIVDQSGNVFSCSLINYGNVVSLSNVEVECILTDAMNHSFSFSNVPDDVTVFYNRIRKRFKFK